MSWEYFWCKTVCNKAQKTKLSLIFEKDKFSYQQFISDLSGVDTRAHNNEFSIIIRNIRDWLGASSKRTNIPGYNIVLNDSSELMQKLPQIVQLSGLNIDDIPFNDFCRIVEGVVTMKSS